MRAGDGSAGEATGDPDVLVREFLSRPSSYAERPPQVDRIETHISSVFLTNRFAYKLKKPVVFEFLDFRDPVTRHATCLEEVRVNRRLAPDIYLGIVPLARDARGNFRWAGPADEPCEWVVKMRRLPDDVRLDRLLTTGQLRPDDLNRLSELLLRFYQQLPPLNVQADTYLAQLQRHIAGNERELQQALGDQRSTVVSRVHDAQRRLLQLWPERWTERVCDGRIVEGHGDLRPEHIYLTPQPVIIDAIEFNAEFRQLDVLDELSFLWVECEMLGSGDVGAKLVRRYRDACQDHPASGVLEFFRSYRACVRAKVAAIRSRQAAGADGRQSLILAERYLAHAADSLGSYVTPWVLVVRGGSGCGKSFVATQLAERLVAELLQTDLVRRDIEGASTRAAATEFGAGRYSPERRQAVYDELLRRADERLAAGRSVVLDGTFASAAARRAAANLATRHHARILEFTCHCPADIALGRIVERQRAGADPSEFRPEWLAAQRDANEPCLPEWPNHALDTLRDADATMSEALSVVRQLAQPVVDAHGPSFSL